MGFYICKQIAEDDITNLLFADTISGHECNDEETSESSSGQCDIEKEDNGIETWSA
jgi:hypothetical protein